MDKHEHFSVTHSITVVYRESFVAQSFTNGCFNLNAVNGVYFSIFISYPALKDGAIDMKNIASNISIAQSFTAGRGNKPQIGRAFTPL